MQRDTVRSLFSAFNRGVVDDAHAFLLKETLNDRRYVRIFAVGQTPRRC